MTEPTVAFTLLGAPSFDRAARWRDRIRGLVEGATEEVPDHVRLNIEDFVAAALGEATEVLEKAKTQLEAAYLQRDASKETARKRAKHFVQSWLETRPFMRGMLAVRHLDVHVQARYSGRILQIQPPDSRPRIKVWWTHPAIPADQHTLLWPSSRLSDSELAEFNRYLHDTDLREVLDRILLEVSEFHEALASQLR